MATNRIDVKNGSTFILEHPTAFAVRKFGADLTGVVASSVIKRGPTEIICRLRNQILFTGAETVKFTCGYTNTLQWITGETLHMDVMFSKGTDTTRFLDFTYLLMVAQGYTREDDGIPTTSVGAFGAGFNNEFYKGVA